MKVFGLVLVALALVGAVLALRGNEIPSAQLKDIEKAFKDALGEKLYALRDDGVGAESGSAINWTWNSWTDGPACNDFTKFSLVDLSNESLQTINGYLSAVLSQVLSLFSSYGFNLGLGLGVSYNGKIIFMDNVGVKNASTTEKPTADTVFSIGSVSKIFTSMMMNVLAEKGALDVSDPLTKYFNKDDTPEFNPPNPYDPEAGANAVTLESLSSQSSGLPREAQCISQDNCTEELAVTMGNQFPLYHTPLTRPHYSNFGFALLGHACERAARKQSGSSTLKYEDWLKDNIFTPFNMTLSGFDYPPEIKDAMAVGYTVDQTGKQVPDASFATSLGWSNPAGGMYSSMNDMMNFIMHLTEMDGVLSPNGYEEYFLAGVPMPDGVSSYGKSGWEVAYANGYKTLTKGGLFGGFATTIAFIPQIKLGTFAWLNIGSSLPVSQLTAIAMNQIVPMIKKEILQNQPKHEFPSVVDGIVGAYVDNATQKEKVIFKKANDSDDTGIFVGNISHKAVFFKYDKAVTEAMNQNNVYYFRYYSVLANGDTCFSDASAGFDDGLIAFRQDESTNEWYASAPDALLFNLVRADFPPSSSSAHSQSSSSSNPGSSSSVPPQPSSSSHHSSSSVPPQPSSSSHHSSSVHPQPSSHSVQPSSSSPSDTGLIVGICITVVVLVIAIVAGVFVVMYVKKIGLFKPPAGSYVNLPDAMES